MSTEKTKVMLIGKVPEERIPLNITLRGITIEEVQQFKYLGSKFGNDGHLDQEISNKIQNAAAAFHNMKHIWSSSYTINFKTLMFRVHVLPVLLYSCETWALTEAQLSRLETFQMKCLRRIVGVTLLDKHRNIDILRLCDKQETIADLIRLQRLRWFGHMMRMSGHRLPRQIFHAKVLGGHANSGASKQWVSLIHADIEKLGKPYDWYRTVRERTKWRDLITRRCTSYPGKSM